MTKVSRNGQRYIQLPAEVLDRAKGRVDAHRICVEALTAACDAVAAGEPRTLTLTFDFKVVRTLEMQVRRDIERGPAASEGEEA